MHGDSLLGVVSLEGDQVEDSVDGVVGTHNFNVAHSTRGEVEVLPRPVAQCRHSCVPATTETSGSTDSGHGLPDTTKLKSSYKFVNKNNMA